MTTTMRNLTRTFLAILFFLAAISSTAQSPEREWRYFGADAAFTRYSPLDRIDHGNVGDLEVVWRRRAIRRCRRRFPTWGSTRTCVRRRS